MFTHVENRAKRQFADKFEGKRRKHDRLARIAQKHSFLIDGLTVKAL